MEGRSEREGEGGVRERERGGMVVVIGMIDEFFNFNLLLTLVCTQHVNKFN